MIYNTIVEKDENNILRLIKAAEQFSEERFLEGIKLKRYDIRILYTVETCLGCVSFLLWQEKHKWHKIIYDRRTGGL